MENSELKIPTHLAVIMDGNGRWANQRSLPRAAGHRAGVENLRRVIDACIKFNIKYLTIYAFSTENWGRPESEVRTLMRLFARSLEQEVGTLHDQGVCINHLGDLTPITPILQEKVLEAIERTKNNQTLILNIAFNYGGRAEIIHAVKQIIDAELPSSQINEKSFSQYLFTQGQPDPDLIIRTSGELRVSNFLIWQAAYAEFYAAPEYWPDFNEEALRKALVAYSERDRRYGKLNES